ncbi:MAG TPA: nucleotidyltransferase domain-containing protein [Thermomicrobiales bacterium]|nr:nucleotidyltransferase domain-containing protein [Thermomicrobiales bacterium]
MTSDEGPRAGAGWQEGLARELAALLEPDAGVRALALFGSAARGGEACDAWSDVDALVVVDGRARERFYPAPGWLRQLGDLYAWDQSAGEFAATTRVCFRDLRRLDLVIATEAALARIADWPRVPFWGGVRVLFSRSAVADHALAGPFARPAPPLLTPEEYAALANRFWFKATLAVGKVARGDLLIALHLALDLVRDCCVLGMVLRDRETGTAHHREGGSGNEVVAGLAGAAQPYTAAGILESVEQSAVAFDRLARRWSAGYREQRGPLLALIERARRTLAAGSEGAEG